MIPDAFMPSPESMSQLIDTVALYGACGVGLGLIGWVLGYMLYFVLDLVRGSLS